jgi:hypothetical protein
MKEFDVHEWFYYDANSPTGLRWNKEIRSGRDGCILKHNKGDIAGYHDHNKGYLKVSANHTSRCVHRLVWEIFYGQTDLQIDHIDGIKNNNKIENLRPVDNKTNCKNKNMYKCNSTGVTGVGFTTTNNGVLYVMGYYKDENCKNCRKHFSTKKFGLLPAFKMAVEYRQRMIAQLIEEGQPYTERHGK